MGTTSAIEQDCSARHELSIFMERFRHLAEGAAVLVHSERDEYAESLLHWGMSDCQTEPDPREEHDCSFEQSHCHETSSEQPLRSVKDLQAALSIMDLALEQLWLEKDRVALLQAQLESEQQSHRLKSEKDFAAMGGWISRYKQIFSENVHLRTRLAMFQERFGTI